VANVHTHGNAVKLDCCVTVRIEDSMDNYSMMMPIMSGEAVLQVPTRRTPAPVLGGTDN
jgi:hypothetical protein